MKIKIGNTRRATWRGLSDTFQSTSTTGDFLTLGGWEDSETANRKIMLALDEKEARQLFERLQRRFEPSAADLRAALTMARLFAGKHTGHEAQDVIKMLDHAVKGLKP